MSAAHHDDKAEAAVLGAVLLDNGVISGLTLSPRDFYREAHRVIWTAMVTLAAEGKPIDVVTLQAQLTDSNQLKSAGGGAYLVDLLNATPVAATVDHYAEIVHNLAYRRFKRDRLRRALHHLETGGEDWESHVETELETLLEQEDRSERPDWQRWFHPIGRHGWSSTRPAPRRPLLTVGPVDRERWSGDPNYEPPLYLPRGKTALLAAAGGVGKTQAVTQLAVSVATGRPWLGTYHVPQPGPVLLALGEEDAEEMHRRIYWAMADLKLSDTERDRVDRHLVALPLSGIAAALVDGDGLKTTFARALLNRLSHTEDGWRLVILEPASRFMGPEAEVDNAAATRFVEVLEQLTKVPGNPTVLAAHHTTKVQRRSGDLNATGVRGSSAFVDGVRWVATMSPATDDTDEADTRVRLHLAKTNYGPPVDDLVLCRGDRGILNPTNSIEPQNEFTL